MVADGAELATCTAFEAPPDTCFHAVFDAHDGFAHVVELVGIAVLAIILHQFEEVGIGVERTCQLVGVTPIDIRLGGVVPQGCLVAVERVACCDGDVGEHFLQPARYLFEVAPAALVPRGVVGLVEGRECDDLMIRIMLLDVLRRGSDGSHPVVDVGFVVGAIVVADACLLVTVQDDVAVGAQDVGKAYATAENADLRIGHGSVARQRGIGTEAGANHREVFGTDVVDATPHVAFVGPCRVHAPADGQFLALGADGEGHIGARRGYGLQIVG